MGGTPPAVSVGRHSTWVVVHGGLQLGAVVNGMSGERQSTCHFYYDAH